MPKARARRTDPQTSQDAAASITPESLRARQYDVWHLLDKYGPLPDFALLEIYKAEAAQGNVVPQSDSGVRTRRAELYWLGLVKFTARYTETPSGRAAMIWKAIRPDG